MAVASHDTKLLGKLALESARGAVVAAHAASGLARHNSEALRLLRSAEGIIRAAVAVLHSPAWDAKPQAAAGVASDAQAGPVAKKKPRRRKGKPRAEGDGNVRNGMQDATNTDNMDTTDAAASPPVASQSKAAGSAAMALVATPSDAGPNLELPDVPAARRADSTGTVLQILVIQFRTWVAMEPLDLSAVGVQLQKFHDLAIEMSKSLSQLGNRTNPPGI